MHNIKREFANTLVTVDTLEQSLTCTAILKVGVAVYVHVPHNDSIGALNSFV